MDSRLARLMELYREAGRLGVQLLELLAAPPGGLQWDAIDALLASRAAVAEAAEGLLGGVQVGPEHLPELMALVRQQQELEERLGAHREALNQRSAGFAENRHALQAARQVFGSAPRGGQLNTKR